MRLWTIQPLSVWEQIRDAGEARVDPKRWNTRGSLPPSYDWLRRQLANRLLEYEGGFPWWFYCEKPDLRLHRHGYLAGGRHQVRMELEVEPSRVQLLRIWAWNQVYCGLYLGTRLQERDWRRRRKRAGINPDLHDSELGDPWRLELENSWRRVFNVLPSRRNDAGNPSGHEAVVEILRRKDIRKVDEFQTTYSSFEARYRRSSVGTEVIGDMSIASDIRQWDVELVGN